MSGAGKASHLLSGAQGEDQALAHLQSHGLKLLERNYRGRRGELDLVMLDGPTLVFIEVRVRAGRARVSAGESIDARKQAHIVMTAQAYLQAHSGHAERACRFDVVTIDGAGEAQRMAWLKGAFDAA